MLYGIERMNLYVFLPVFLQFTSPSHQYTIHIYAAVDLDRQAVVAYSYRPCYINHHKQRTDKPNPPLKNRADTFAAIEKPKELLEDQEDFIASLNWGK